MLFWSERGESDGGGTEGGGTRRQMETAAVTRSWRLDSPQITNYLHDLQNKPENNFPRVQEQDKPLLKCPQQENKGLCLLNGQTQTDAVSSLNKDLETETDEDWDHDAALNTVWKLSPQHWAEITNIQCSVCPWKAQAEDTSLSEDMSLTWSESS